MKIEAELLGLEDALEKMAKFIKQESKAEKAMVEATARTTANIAKDRSSGNYKDRTSNLRNSIGVNADHKDVVHEPALTKINFPSDQMADKAEVKGNEKTAYVYAGMNYAQRVEDKEGYSVLQDAIDQVEPIAKTFGLKYLKPEKVMKK